jgi:hypothetical protein
MALMGPVEEPSTASTTEVKPASFDHFVGQCKQGRGHGDAERFGGLEVDHESELAGLLDRQVAGLYTPKMFRNEGTLPACGSMRCVPA